MTDDFQLFQDQDGGDAVDPDVALVTAYLARELSVVQVVAVEDRLAKDAAFREKVRPILEAWMVSAPARAAGAGSLTREEVEAGWQRYVGQHAELDAHEGPRLVVDGAQPKRRKVSMTRIAAGIAAITLPLVTLAQVVVYASRHPEVPGHSVAKQVVAPFAEPPAAPPEQPRQPLPSPVDVRVGRQLEKATPEVQRAAPAAAPLTPAAEATTPAQSSAVAAPLNPDRAKIVALLNRNMPEVIRGDTNVSYVVMVMDAADNYVWGTYGSGPVLIAVSGDKRSAAERAAFNREHMADYLGVTPGLRGGAAGALISGGAMGAGGRGGGGGRVRAIDSGAGRVDSARIALDSGRLRQVIATRGVADTLAARLRVRGDSTLSIVATGGGARGGGGGGGAGGGFGAVTAGGRGGAGFGFNPSLSQNDSTSYTVGMARWADRAPDGLNAAAGLQEPGKGESGIQGLKAVSLAMGENYSFAPGQLLKQPLRVIVVHLVPGADWKGR